MIRCIAFDFDGTLVHSNAIKHDAFLEIAARHTGGQALMRAILADPPGDRRAVMALFAARIGGGIDPDTLVADYGRRCEERILRCPARRGADTALAALRRAGLRLYVNSATPTEPLRAVIHRRYGKAAFNGVYGGHGAKVANLRAIMDAEGIGPASLAMIGDGIDDRDAAHETGCAFFGVDAGTLAERTGSDGLLSDLSGLPDLIAASDGEGRT